MEVWGANGGRGYGYGDAAYRNGGRGGYSYGTINLSKNTMMYIYIGQKGTDNPCAVKNCTTSGGWNGGGSGSNRGPDERGGAGGGSTDISLQGTSNSSIWNESKHLYSRVIVAGAGGGGDGHTTNDVGDGVGCYGGGLNGESGRLSRNKVPCTGASQTAGGVGTGWCSTLRVGGASCSTSTSHLNGTSGGFGYGGGTAGFNSNVNYYDTVSGGGAGWYGGGGHSYGPAGGGSGYIFTSSTVSNYPSGGLVDSTYYLTSAATLAGNQTFKSPSGTNETGHTGNGYARITYLGASI